MNADLWKIVYGTCQYGDNFYELIIDDSKKEIVALKYLPPTTVERQEVDGNLLGFLVSKTILQKEGQQITVYAHPEKADKTRLQPWEVVHFKIDDNAFAPYGRSILNSGRRTWKQLSLMEDAMLVYRLERAPEKRVFYIDVGTLSTPEAEKFIERIKAKFRKRKFIDPVSGQINEKASPLSILEDFWIPVRTTAGGGVGGTKIDILQGGRQLNEIDDTKYFRDKILKTMVIPPQYLQEGGGMDTRNALSQMDIKFSRSVERIQRHIVKGLEKIAIIALVFEGYRGDDLKNFELSLTPPSNIAEMLEMEVLNQKIGLISTILGIGGFLPTKWVYKNIMKFSDKEIADIQTELQLQAAVAQPPEGAIGGIGAGGMAPALPAGPEAGGIAGVEAIPAEAPPGAEVAPPPEAEVAPVPAPTEVPAPAPEVAGLSPEVGSKKFLIENREGILKLINYIKHKPRENKDNVKHAISENSAAPTYNNSYRKQYIRGEFKGLTKR